MECCTSVSLLFPLTRFYFSLHYQILFDDGDESTVLSQDMKPPPSRSSVDDVLLDCDQAPPPLLDRSSPSLRLFRSSLLPRLDENYGNQPNRAEAIPIGFWDRILDGFNLDNADELRDAAHFCIGIGFCLRRKQDHVRMTFSQLEWGVDEHGRKIARFSPSYSKNHNSGVGQGKRHCARFMTCLDPDDPRDPYNIITKLRDMHPGGYTGRVYNQTYTGARNPLMSCDGVTPAWYNTKKPLGHNTLGNTVGRAAPQLGSHSLRSPGARLLLEDLI